MNNFKAKTLIDSIHFNHVRVLMVFFCLSLSAICRRTLTLAIELGERAVEAQACYSLGNTYTLLRDFPVAIEYHQRHLTIAQELGDKVGEARACWSLGNAHSSIGNHEKALTFAQQHYNLAKDVSVFNFELIQLPCVRLGIFALKLFNLVSLIFPIFCTMHDVRYKNSLVIQLAKQRPE